MRKRKSGCPFVSVLTASLLVSPVAWAQTPITTDGISCVPKTGNAKILVHADKAKAAGGVRVYFHKAGATSGDYFIQLTAGEGDEFVGVLPAVSAGTDAVEYHVAALDADAKETALVSATASVTDTCAATLTSDEEKLAKNVVVGETVAGQPEQPEGFACKGVVGVITASGELKQNDQCRKGGGAFLTVGALGAGILGGGLILNNVGGNRPVPISPSRPDPNPIK